MPTARQFINPHKTLTPFFIVALMVYYENTRITSLIYFALHSSYCLNWYIKEIIFPDKSFDTPISFTTYLLGTAVIYNYWCAPWLLMRSQTEPSGFIVVIAVFLNVVGNFLHYSCDAQKFFVLQERKGLITNGFFARSRNLNYLGEIMTYLGLALLSGHWWPVASLTVMVVFVFFPMMWKKDNSLSRYDDYEAYKQQSNLLIPKLW